LVTHFHLFFFLSSSLILLKLLFRYNPALFYTHKTGALMEQTLSIIKPDAVAKGVIGKILDRFESNGLKIAAMKKVQLSRQDAEAFYAVHAARPFFNDLVDFMVSGPVVITVLEGENAVLKNRDLMGATNPKEAEAGTIRADFAENIDANAVHGSDSAENAKNEIAFFFSGREIS
jgi:nucleoside-diphosphate kinase